MSFSSKTLLKTLGYVAASITAVLVIAAICIHLLAPYADRYRPEIEAWASTTLHQAVKIEEISTRWQGWHPAVRLNGVTIYSQPPETPVLHIQHVQISLNILESLWHRRLIPSQLRVAGTHLVVEQIDTHQYRINGISVTLPDLAAPSQTSTAWQNLHLQSIVLQNITIDWTGEPVPPAKPHTAKLHIDHLKMALDADNVNLHGKNLTLQIPHLFAQPQSLQTYSGQIHWAANAQGLTIDAQNWQLTNPDFHVQGNFYVFSPKDSVAGPQVNTIMQFSERDISKLRNYVPEVGISPILKAWLKQAFVSGQGLDGKLVLQGPLNHFPFDDQSGKFEATLSLDQLNFRFNPHWPILTELSGELFLHNRSLQIQVHNSKILGVETKTIQGQIPNLAMPELKVHGDVTTDAHEGINLIHQSPLNQTIGKALSHFDLHGPIQLNLDLQIPLHSPLHPTSIDGKIRLLPDVTLTVPAANIVLQKLAGNLQFTSDTLSSTELQAEWLEQPVALQITTTPNKSGENVVKIDMDGKAALTKLQQAYNLDSIKSYISGTSTYHAQLAFSKNKQQQQTSFSLDSDLQGIALNLPQPIKKAKAEKTPTHVQLDFLEDKNLLNVTGNYAKKLSAALTFASSSNKSMAFKSGEVRLGETAAQLSTGVGLTIGGYLAQLDWATIKPYFDSYRKTTGAKTQTAWPLNAIDLTIGQLNAFGMGLKQVNIQAEPSPSNWQVQINSPTIAGHVSIPKAGSRQLIEGEFQHFHLEPGASDNISDIKPQTIPSLRLNFHGFSYGNKSLGDVFLMTYPKENSLQIQKLNISTIGSNLSASGQWKQPKNGQNLTQVQGNLTSTNLGATLKSWSITSSLVNGNGGLTFNASWPDTAYNPNFARLNGNFSLKFQNGRIINISQGTEAEMGLGRVLNLLSLQSLPKRLTLDFSDLVQKGFSFDIMQGDFNLNAGNAVTQNAYMKGSVAKVTIKGRIGLGAKDYDLTMITTPYVTSSLPAIATLAGGPIAGAATWVASKVFSGVVNKITSSTYHISGPWDKPEVVKL